MEKEFFNNYPLAYQESTVLRAHTSYGFKRSSGYLHIGSLSGRFLIKHTFKSRLYNPFQRPQGACTIFVLSRVLVSTGRDLLHASGDLVFIAPVQGIFFDWLAPVAREACVIGSPRSIAIRGTVLGWLIPEGTAQTEARHTLPVFLWKRPICLSRSIGLRADFWSNTHLGAYEGTLWEQGLVDVVLLLSLCLTSAYWYLSERSL